MIVNITIPAPVLAPGEIFKVRYRLAGSPTWTNAPDQTNAQFTLNLPPGEYELEVMLIKANGTECPVVIQPFSVKDTEGSPCIVAEAELVPDGRGYALEITYSQANPAPCGYVVTIAPVGAIGAAQSYTTLPASPWRIPATNQPYNVSIDMVLCNGDIIRCYTQQVDAVAVPCQPAVLNDSDIVFAGQQAYVKLIITQSVPSTSPFTVYYNQMGIPISGPLDGGGPLYLSASGTPTSILIPVNPNYNMTPQNGLQEVRYNGSFIDACGNTMKWEAARALT